MGSTSNPARAKLIRHFTRMGFHENLVAKAIDENGEENSEEVILDTLLTYLALEESRPQCEFVPIDLSSQEFERDNTDDISDAERSFRNEEISEHQHLYSKEKKRLHLVDMGFLADEVSSAMEACDPDTSIIDLMDHITAARMAETYDDNHQQQEPPNVNKRKSFEEEQRWESEIGSWRKKEKVSKEKQKKLFVDEDEEAVHFPRDMVGFGLPNEPIRVFMRELPDSAIAPLFYFESVAHTPKGVCRTVSRCLHEIEPKFVDSTHFGATTIKRWYLHNLPIDNRFRLMPIPPQTIQEALPLTKRWWPAWDSRTKLNCVNTGTASAMLTGRIRNALERLQENPRKTQEYVLKECRQWNLIWTGKNIVACLEPEEIEIFLGLPKNHTRGGGISRTERFKSLSNSFQVDVVAYHLSVLKDKFLNGISVLSLFSGIGVAEIALHRLGIPLKNVISVEISEVNRYIFRSWWEETEQKGNLIDDITDVHQLTMEKLDKLIQKYGGFDLIIGGNPCNNLTGSTQMSKDGLEGNHSILFHEYCRILDNGKCLMAGGIN